MVRDRVRVELLLTQLVVDENHKFGSKSHRNLKGNSVFRDTC